MFLRRLGTFSLGEGSLYLHGRGRHLRQWVPLFLYVVPVNLAAALMTSLASLLLEEGVTWGGMGPRTLFGWFSDARWFLYTMGLGLISGTMGHAMANLALKYIPSLVVSMGLLLEPVFGSLLGWAAGKQGSPDGFTFLGGIVLLLGAAIATIGSSYRPSSEQLLATQLDTVDTRRWSADVDVVRESIGDDSAA